MCPYKFYALDSADMDRLSDLEFAVLNEVWGILPPHTLTPDFWQTDNTVDLDAATSPLAYLESYIKLARLFETHAFPLFNALPLRDIHSQSYVTIDSTLLKNAILQMPHLPIKTPLDKQAVWGRCFDLNHLSFHQRGRNAGTHRFDGTVQTDGVGLSVLLKAKHATRAGPPPHKPKMTKACRKALIKAIPHASRRKNITLRYPLPQLRKERYLRKFRDRRELLRRVTMTAGGGSIMNLEWQAPSKKTMNVANFAQWITWQETHCGDLEECYDDGEFNTMKLTSIRRTMMSEDNLINKMRKTFGRHLMVVMGDWSSSTGGKHKRWHEPQKVANFRKLLKKHHIPCFLMDEFHTSSFCPTCCFHLDRNIVPCRLSPRPWQAAMGTMVIVHGLLGCRFCAHGYRKYKYWNRDMVAVLNMDLKLQALLNGSSCPDWLSRSAL
ncbi:hypothetical protein BDZ88DRAFT_283567 [Geranomyces variabilis]|nr:hypothetical protein BDZ88DRAFT_283567 [Geranomyces variabilis]